MGTQKDKELNQKISDEIQNRLDEMGKQPYLNEIEKNKLLNLSYRLNEYDGDIIDLASTAMAMWEYLFDVYVSGERKAGDHTFKWARE